MVDVVNVVSSGSLDIELDLEAVAQELGDLVDYDPGKYPGAYFRFGESEPLITLYRTGKYIITGSSSEQEAMEIRDRFLTTLHDHGVLPESDDSWFSIQNYVGVGDLEESVNLSALAIGLGLEKTEYEPEQFPGLVYRPTDYESVLLVFGSGKTVITGAKSIEEAESAFRSFRSEFRSLFES
ncbi:TATA-box-binding protein [Natrinema altunense]|uniref:TATA-box-binding protein n=1 Tax=Natrinema altunense (strain JCM 12890 / CGMCC 1.3731 / AJ2) TaxID=1227494 RepID=L9ZAZ5_NATA2|nr:TATA-box-binding protein [Natrinema altunense]ELY83650.1 transcription factor [Natrinema altunense JCM 12890]